MRICLSYQLGKNYPFRLLQQSFHYSACYFKLVIMVCRYLHTAIDSLSYMFLRKMFFLCSSGLSMANVTTWKSQCGDQWPHALREYCQLFQNYLKFRPTQMALVAQDLSIAPMLWMKLIGLVLPSHHVLVTKAKSVSISPLSHFPMRD